MKNFHLNESLRQERQLRRAQHCTQIRDAHKCPRICEKKVFITIKSIRSTISSIQKQIPSPKVWKDCLVHEMGKQETRGTAKHLESYFADFI